jgi:hypothetical protein
VEQSLTCPVEARKAFRLNSCYDRGRKRRLGWCQAGAARINLGAALLGSPDLLSFLSFFLVFLKRFRIFKFVHDFKKCSCFFKKCSFFHAISNLFMIFEKWSMNFSKKCLRFFKKNS